MRQLTIDPEFRDKIPSITEDEFKRLEENILNDGEVREPLVVWNDTIIDGHHRWEIIQRHPEIPYRIKDMDFPDRWAAVVWMCRNQLGRRNVTPQQRDYLIKEQYDAQSKTVGGQFGNENAKKQSGENLHFVSEVKPKTREIIAKEHGITQGAVKSAVEFGRGLDAADEVAPGFKNAVLSGEVTASKQIISDIRNLPDEKKKDVVEAIKQGDTDTARSIIRPIHVPDQDEEREPMTVSEFVELLESVVQDIDDGFRLHMVLTHRDMLNTKECRNATLKVLEKCKETIDKYINMVNMIEEE